MPNHHLVRVGAMGQIGRFIATDATCYQRHHRVIVRTCRGLEIGEVLVSPESGEQQSSSNESPDKGVEFGEFPDASEKGASGEGTAVKGPVVEGPVVEGPVVKDTIGKGVENQLDGKSGEYSEGVDGQILRGMTPQDRLLEARLEAKRQKAYQACVEMLAQQNRNDCLIDVEHLFDGQGLYFYFLGEVTQELEEQTQQLAEAYESKVQFRKFTETLLEGCGPDCGSDLAGGQGGCQDCTGCSVVAACGSR